MGKTSIEWTDETWNPVRGCTVLSPGCKNCYAMKQAYRSAHPGGAYEGLVQLGLLGPVWNGKTRFVPSVLQEPLHWKRPRMVFVNSMSDLFHEGFTFEEIAAVWGVMAATPQHTYQVLTKRVGRALNFFDWLTEKSFALGAYEKRGVNYADGARSRFLTEEVRKHTKLRENIDRNFPLSNVWLCVSVEDQKHADERVPLLLRSPAGVRGVSYEPALGPVDFFRWLRGTQAVNERRLDWIIVGGESGPRARPFDVAWAERVIEQCRAADVPCFVKQMGSRPMMTEGVWPHEGATTGKGGNWEEWPVRFRVREYPEVRVP